MADAVRSLRPLWEASRGSRSLLAASILFMAIGMGAMFFMPQAVRFAVDCVIGGAAPEGGVMGALRSCIAGLGMTAQLASCAGLVLAAEAVRSLCFFSHKRLMALSAESSIKRLRDRLFEHILSMTSDALHASKTGDIIQRCTADVDVVRVFLSTHIAEIVRSVLISIMAYAIMFEMDARMALVSFAFIPMVLIYSALFMRRAARRYIEADEAEGELLSIAQENFTGVRVVRAFARERSEIDRFAAQNDEYTGRWISLGGMLSTYWGIGDLFMGMQMLTTCIAGIVFAAEGSLTVGEFIVFINYSAMVIWPVRALGRSVYEAGKASASAARAMAVLDEPREQDEPGAREDAPRGDIELRSVSFSRGEHEVLRDVSFTIREGSTLGIIGATGSGKTTIAHLLCRMNDADSGEITIGGVDIRRFSRRAVRRAVALVPQEPFLYSRSIAANIASLSDEPTLGEIRSAAEAAQIDDTITRFPRGYATAVGERGVTLSGGQRQRAAIARALVKRPPFLIFDDSLSAVDTETDARIRAALRERTRGATVIVIAHRVSSVASADWIVVMKEGRVAEQGAPADLYARGGEYRRVCDSQRPPEGEL